MGTLVFGFFNTLQIYSGALAGAFPGGLGWLNAVPAQLFKALPFIIPTNTCKGVMFQV